MFNIVFSKNALVQLNNLPLEIKQRVWDKLQQCKENPFHFLEHLEDIKGFKLRIGNYRAIVDLDNSTKIITVLRVGHRSKIYD